jgi:uncharacterized membrane protein YgcG
VTFDVLGVERDGETEDWFTESVSNGVRLNTGGDDFLPVPAEYEFLLRYRTERQLGFFPDHDELYWNAIGTDWIFPIESASVLVRMFQPVPVEDMGVEGYTGPQGARGNAYVAEILAPGIARYRLSAPLAPFEGFTIVLTFPKGVIAPPTPAERVGRSLMDNRGVLIALTGLTALLIYCLQQWRRVGRDPRKGIVIPRYEPSKGHTPAGLRYVRRMGYDPRVFSSDLLALAVSGHLGIERKRNFFRDEWTLVGKASNAPVAPSQRALLERLLPRGKGTLVLKNTNAGTLSAARTIHEKALETDLHGRYFKRNLGSLIPALLIAAPTVALALLTSGGFGIPAIIAVSALMGATLLLFSYLFRAPTPEGRTLLDEIEGLELYLSVAERDELADLAGPDAPPALDAARFEALLPFAVALEVEDAWTKKFTAAVGAATAAQATSALTWYSGRGPITDMGAFSRAVGTSLSSQISSSSTPPGSSSGSGGGGSSGGGGGGGGGGGR